MPHKPEEGNLKSKGQRKLLKRSINYKERSLNNVHKIRKDDPKILGGDYDLNVTLKKTTDFCFMPFPNQCPFIFFLGAG